MTASNSEIIEKVLNDIAQRNQYSNWKSVIKDKQSLSFEAKEFEIEVNEIIQKALSLKEQENQDKLADLQEKIEKIIVENVGNHYILSSRDKILKEISKIFNSQGQEKSVGSATRGSAELNPDTQSQEVGCGKWFIGFADRSRWCGKILPRDPSFKEFCPKCKKKFKPKFLKIKEMGK